MSTGQIGAGSGPYVGDYGFDDLVKAGIEKRKARQHDGRKDLEPHPDKLDLPFKASQLLSHSPALAQT